MSVGGWGLALRGGVSNSSHTDSCRELQWWLKQRPARVRSVSSYMHTHVLPVKLFSHLLFACMHACCVYMCVYAELRKALAAQRLQLKDVAAAAAAGGRRQRASMSQQMNSRLADMQQYLSSSAWR